MLLMAKLCAGVVVLLTKPNPGDTWGGANVVTGKNAADVELLKLLMLLGVTATNCDGCSCGRPVDDVKKEEAVVGR